MRKFNSHSIFKITIFILIFALISSNFFVSAVYIPQDTEYVWSESTIETSNNSASNINSEDFLDLTCESAILIEQTTGTILYEKNSNIKLHPASVTKIMTILLIMEAIENRSNIL